MFDLYVLSALVISIRNQKNVTDFDFKSFSCGAWWIRKQYEVFPTIFLQTMQENGWKYQYSVLNRFEKVWRIYNSFLFWYIMAKDISIARSRPEIGTVVREPETSIVVPENEADGRRWQFWIPCKAFLRKMPRNVHFEWKDIKKMTQ